MNWFNMQAHTYENIHKKEDNIFVCLQSAIDKDNENQGSSEMAPPAPEKSVPVEDGAPNGVANTGSNNVNGTTNPAYTSDQVVIMLHLLYFM